MRLGVRRFVRRFSLLPLLFVALAATACKENTPADDPGTTPTDFTVTETFNGTLFKNGGASYSFSVARSGTIIVTLKSVSDTVEPSVPAPNIGMSLGSWDGLSCSVNYGVFTDNASASASIAGTVPAAGILCVRVYDPANYVTNPLIYSVVVTHP